MTTARLEQHLGWWRVIDAHGVQTRGRDGKKKEYSSKIEARKALARHLNLVALADEYKAKKGGT